MEENIKSRTPRLEMHDDRRKIQTVNLTPCKNDCTLNVSLDQVQSDSGNKAVPKRMSGGEICMCFGIIYIKASCPVFVTPCSRRSTCRSIPPRTMSSSRSGLPPARPQQY